MSNRRAIIKSYRKSFDGIKITNMNTILWAVAKREGASTHNPNTAAASVIPAYTARRKAQMHEQWTGNHNII